MSPGAHFALLGMSVLLLFSPGPHPSLSKCKSGACLKTSNWQRVNQLSCWEVNLNELSLNSYKKLISLESNSIKHLYNPEKGWQD